MIDDYNNGKGEQQGENRSSALRKVPIQLFPRAWPVGALKPARVTTVMKPSNQSGLICLPMVLLEIVRATKHAHSIQ
jgi:hypothetical protein